MFEGEISQLQPTSNQTNNQDDNPNEDIAYCSYKRRTPGLATSLDYNCKIDNFLL